MEAVGQLTGGIAHDFNNLLTAIIGSLDLIRKRLRRRARACRPCRRSPLQAAQRGAMLVSQLLAFGRRQTLQPQSVRLEHALGRRPPADRPGGRQRGGAPDRDRRRPVAPASSTARSSNSAILNLVFNAHDAMPRGGTLTIVADNRAIDAAAARSLDIAAGDYVRIAVTDTGAGMAPETALRAFEPFFTTKGVGKRHRASASARSAASPSSRAAPRPSRAGRARAPRWRCCCRAPRPSATMQAVAEPADHPVSPKRILVVEDSKEVRALAQSLLEDLGHEAIVAPQAEAALAILSGEQSIDLLFCDVALSGPIDGRKLAELARQMRPGLKVLMTTGYPDLMRGPAGAPPIIAKPYHQADLAVKLAELFDT